MTDEQRELDECPACGGSGEDVEYVGLDMRPVAVDCWRCGGTGRAIRAVKESCGG